MRVQSSCPVSNVNIVLLLLFCDWSVAPCAGFGGSPDWPLPFINTADQVTSAWTGQLLHVYNSILCTLVTWYLLWSRQEKVIAGGLVRLVLIATHCAFKNLLSVIKWRGFSSQHVPVRQRLWEPVKDRRQETDILCYFLQTNHWVGIRFATDVCSPVLSVCL